MGQYEWAEKEIQIACDKERNSSDSDDWDYGIACYQSALKAYKSLCDDGHSGFSFNLTKNILTRLMNGQPLTPITDEDFKEENQIIGESPEDLVKRGLKSSIQCHRMSSLFRHEDLDGNVSYTDVERYYCFEIDDADDTYIGGGSATILDELFPITMPYYPYNGKYAIACDTFMFGDGVGDFDTKGYIYVITPDGERVEINKFFKEVKIGEEVTEEMVIEHYVESGDPDDDGMITIEPVRETVVRTYQPTDWVEISKEEFEERKRNKNDTYKEE